MAFLPILTKVDLCVLPLLILSLLLAGLDKVRLTRELLMCEALLSMHRMHSRLLPFWE